MMGGQKDNYVSPPQIKAKKKKKFTCIYFFMSEAEQSPHFFPPELSLRPVKEETEG